MEAALAGRVMTDVDEIAVDLGDVLSAGIDTSSLGAWVENDDDAAGASASIGPRPSIRCNGECGDCSCGRRLIDSSTGDG